MIGTEDGFWFSFHTIGGKIHYEFCRDAEMLCCGVADDEAHMLRLFSDLLKSSRH